MSHDIITLAHESGHLDYISGVSQQKSPLFLLFCYGPCFKWSIVPRELTLSTDCAIWNTESVQRATRHL